ncbi:4Fe-4S dicluster domain-containing protein [uncultured Alistipes sp.]|uniref:4Fe-4S dicluster domain-containing protein n=2 Tax=uncultured Alistipes sp. TaxID=538949 RepID=UPI00261FC7B1|nr:4Fe-4S dicluster domain-containing protein [uncultured Alistipes sp.]
MRRMEWGFTISRPRTVDLDRNDMEYSKRLLREFPELQTCIACGNCTATCTAGNLTKFNVRKLQTLVRRGEYEGVRDELSKCMLCGKCRLLCPRGINIRRLVQKMKKELP